MADIYHNFKQLAEKEAAGQDFCIRFREVEEAPLVIAPHGGNIEPGTTELADAIAGLDFSFYAFEGLKTAGNSDLHITSTRFDEPWGIDLVAKSPTVVALHGEASEECVVFLGGRDRTMIQRVRTILEDQFLVETHRNPALQGESTENICNRGIGKKGIQLEVSKGLRKTFFPSLTWVGRQTRTPQFYAFVTAVRKALADAT